MRTLLLMAVFAGACQSGADVTLHPDLSVGDVDLGASLDSAVPDLFMCGQRRDTGVQSKSVINTMTVPMDFSQFALDLNGDGRPDNQLGNIMGAFTALGLDVQTPLTLQIQSGSDPLLIEVFASAFTADPCAATDVLHANAHPNPDFSGSGSFAIAPSPSPASFPGAIGATGFSTAEAAEPIRLQMILPFGGALVPVQLVDAHLTFSLGADGTPTLGQVNGAIREGDVTGQVLPEVARQLNAQVAPGVTTFDGGSSVAPNQLLQIFDVGCSSAGALNFDGTPAAKGDGKIALCEVSENGIIQNLILPDVQLFDQSGNFAPNPDNTNKDSLSVGLGFTAAHATF